MNRIDMPANIYLMDTRVEKLSQLKPITSLDTFEGGNSQSYHPDGLFSDVIFGRTGTPERDVRYGRIDLKIPLLHPFIFRKIVKLKGLYKDVILGKAYAVFNPKTKDLELSDVISGETGYHFFMTVLPSLHFKETESNKREQDIILTDKAIENGLAFIHSVPVVPAGFRDVYVEADGRVTEDEINSRYRSLIASANSIPDNADSSSNAFNTTRVTMQNAINAIFDYLYEFFEGKNGFGLNRFYSRGVFNGTRNVISAIDTVTPYLGAPNGPKMQNTVVGLYQTMKALLPVAQHLLLTGWLGKVFNQGGTQARLINKRTLRSELVALSRRNYDKYTTPEGVETLIQLYYNRAFRHSPVVVEDHYVGLVYKGIVDGKKVFKIIGDIDELPSHLNKDDVTPLTLIELMYLSGYRQWNTYPLSNTRYPVAGLGSTYFSYFYVKTTTTGEMRYELDDHWGIKQFNDGNDIIAAYEYPIPEIGKFFETAAIHSSRLAGLTADFDGDTMSQIGLYTVEAMNEIRAKNQLASTYLDPKGGFLNSPMIDTTQRVIVGLMRRK